MCFCTKLTFFNESAFELDRTNFEYYKYILCTPSKKPKINKSRLFKNVFQYLSFEEKRETELS